MMRLRITVVLSHLLLLLLVVMVMVDCTLVEVDHDHDLQEKYDRMRDIKMELWSQFGMTMLDEHHLFGNKHNIDNNDNNHVDFQLQGMEELLRWKKSNRILLPSSSSSSLSPVAAKLSVSRSEEYSKQKQQQRWRRQQQTSYDWYDQWQNIRGGSNQQSNGQNNDDDIPMDVKIRQLSVTYGPDFVAAIQQNEQDHVNDCQTSCDYYYCAPPPPPTSEEAAMVVDTTERDDNATPHTMIDQLRIQNQTTIRSYSFGAVPPEDFSTDFGFPLDLIHVTQGTPLIESYEIFNIIRQAQEEGVDHNEYQSGKYKLGGNWLTELPNTRQWFNTKLRTTFFPLLAELFPQIISSESVLRAHSVSLLKYNKTHPRTDVHIDNGILALTVAMTPQQDYVGGGTFMEHFVDDEVANDQQQYKNNPTLIEMDVGHATLRPGSVRHGGHRVTAGERYVLGAFILIEDRVEHVRRLKNRGAQLRTKGQLDDAIRHFEWALALNPKCTTCLKDWAEILHVQGDYQAAEQKLRQALDLLEYKDSDALFTLGLILSEQGRDEECIDAYRRSLALNDEDAELLYNLAIKIGERHRQSASGGGSTEEMDLYRRCTEIDPNFGGAWLNLGTALAENGDLASAETMFLRASASHIADATGDGIRPRQQSRDNSEVVPKALVNLAIIYHQQATMAIQQRNIETARSASFNAIKYLDDARPLLDGSSALESYRSQYKVLRMASHRNLGQIFAGTGDMEACERQFRTITNEFPGEVKAWQMLSRVLEVQGKQNEMKEVLAKIQNLQGT